MTPIPARLLRPYADSCRSCPPTTQKERDRLEYILEAAHNMLVRFGRARFKLPDFAFSTRLSQIAIRRSICDLHHLFRLVLSKHLDAVMAEVGAVRRDTPNLQAARRAAYFSATRGVCNVPTPIHFLLMHDRFTLPEDELEPLQQQRAMIGFMLGGENWAETLHLLDCPTLDLEKIEAMHAAMEQINNDRAANPQPAPSLQDIAPTPEPEPTPAPIKMHRPFPIAWLSGELAQVRDEDLRIITQDNSPKKELGMMKPSPPDPPAFVRQSPPPFAPAPDLGNHDATPADSPSPPGNPIPP